jgi:archaellum biogenesis protein FlaJ (TadC family)
MATRSGDAPQMGDRMQKDWDTYYSVLVAVSALIAFIEIVWFLFWNDDRIILLSALMASAAVFWVTWAPGTEHCC